MFCPLRPLHPRKMLMPTSILWNITPPLWTWLRFAWQSCLQPDVSSMSTNNPPCILKLFSWILNMSDRSFFISIEDGQTVAELKEEIVKKNPCMFSHVDTYQLDLWKVHHFSLLGKSMFTNLHQGIHHDQPESYKWGSQTQDYWPIIVVRGRSIVGRFPPRTC